MAGTYHCGNKNITHNKHKAWESPDESMRIGRGYDYLGQDGVVRGDCFSFSPESYAETTWKDLAEGGEQNFSERRVTSFEELLKEFNMSVSASVSGTFGKASGSYGHYEKYVASEENFTWIIKKEVEKASITLKLPALAADKMLKPEALAAYKRGKDDFVSMCGTHFVRGLRKGGSLFYIQQISARATDYIKKIEAHFKASGGTVGLQGKAKFDLNQLLVEATKFNFYSRDLLTVGPQVNLADLTLDSIDKALSKFERDVTPQTSKPISIELASWDTVLPFPKADVLAKKNQELRLKELHDRFWKIKALLEKLDKFQYLHDEKRIKLSSVQLANLETSKLDLESERNEIVNQGSICFVDSTQCQKPLPPRVVVTFPELKFLDNDWYTISLNKWSFRSPTADYTSRPHSKYGFILTSKKYVFMEAENFQLYRLKWDITNPACQDKNFAVAGKSIVNKENPNLKVHIMQDYDSEFGNTVLALVESEGKCLHFAFYPHEKDTSQFDVNKSSQLSNEIKRMLFSAIWGTTTEKL